MKVLVVGANGKIGNQLVAVLAGRGHAVRAMVRDAAQGPALEAHGAEALVSDLEGDCADAPRDCDAVVFTAGSGGHTGADKTLLVDLWGALKMIDAAKAAGASRFVMVSAIGAADPDAGPERIRHYLVAKRVADDRLVASGLDYTVVRPGRLSDEPGTGRVRAGADIGYGEIPRADVAAALAATLDQPSTIGKTFALLAGDTAIDDAIAGV